MSRTVNVQGTLVPLWEGEVGQYGYRPLHRTWMTQERRRLYTKDPAQAVAGELCDASMNQRGVIEAGYCRGTGLSDFDWFESTANTPTA